MLCLMASSVPSWKMAMLLLCVAGVKKRGLPASAFGEVVSTVLPANQ